MKTRYARPQRAEFLVGDVVDELSGVPVQNVGDLERVAAQRRPGQANSISVRRGGERRTLILPA
jgi:S1-C subfamily serine protease